MLAFAILVPLTAVSLQSASPFALLRQIDDPELPREIRKANVTLVAEETKNDPLLCVELARRMKSAWLALALQEVFTDPNQVCTRNLVDVILVLRATDDDMNEHYRLLTPEQLRAAPEFVRYTIGFYGGSGRGATMVYLAQMYGLTEFAEDIAESVLERYWPEHEEIEARTYDLHVAPSLTEAWQMIYGLALSSLRTNDNHAIVDEALKEIRDSLRDWHSQLAEGESPPQDQVELIEKISAILRE